MKSTKAEDSSICDDDVDEKDVGGVLLCIDPGYFLDGLSGRLEEEVLLVLFGGSALDTDEDDFFFLEEETTEEEELNIVFSSEVRLVLADDSFLGLLLDLDRSL